MSDNFTLEEFLASRYASIHKIQEQFNPPVVVIDNILELVAKIIDPLREALGHPIVISSGYRCEKVNTAIGGKPTSQHLVGQAADLKFPYMGNAYLYNKIIEMNLPFDQLIWEFGTDKEPAWVHVSYSSKNRKQILKIS